MSETHFTRLDWRPGKRRKTQPRKQPYAGQKVASPGFLASRALTGLHTMTARRCAAKRFTDGLPCGQPAMKESPFCYMHGGAARAAKVRPYAPTQRSQAAQARRALERLEAERLEAERLEQDDTERV